jgi:molybdopterin-containing oxidoreductase family iron-sulfur binding subunit
VSRGDTLVIESDDEAAELPVAVQPGAADAVIAISDSRLPGLRTDAKVRRADTRRVELVATQDETSMRGRPIVLEGTLAELSDNPQFVSGLRHLPKPAPIHREFDYSERRRWAMAIDLSACVGCGACVVACQAENNVPAVGKEEAGRGREMHWLRIDRYYEGEGDAVRLLRQPMPCQHCENAPCENVCPVLATTHSPEGLNEMTYNRCVGTRYCSNNCPYKVRRFNFFDYAERFAGDGKRRLALNPQVTVRTVGIMEKCTFCVQRLTEARYRFGAGPEPIPDGEVQTACQQTCPAGAIVFGDLNDPDSRVSRLADSERAYRLLEELNTKPRVTYLAKISNPHPGNAAARRDRAAHEPGHETHGETH